MTNFGYRVGIQWRSYADENGEFVLNINMAINKENMKMTTVKMCCLVNLHPEFARVHRWRGECEGIVCVYVWKG